ncbi:MAG: transglutaminase-like domain-containing protein [Candidatus Electrothrix sp. GW3-4]|uniref:transglutaminase-like domain-containing protein n=1 Tax=Candidatus Electrothrix sp. GW3-4 TaxID=3126740 RepID=UPI0030D13389
MQDHLKKTNSLMSLPPFFAGVILLFWGWQTGLLSLALPMALFLEGSRYIKSKWALSLADFNRITDICTILLAGLALFLFTTDFLKAALKLLKWLPAICFPLLAAQQYSIASKIDLRSLLLFARNRVVAVDNQPRTIDIAPPYAALCLLAAGTGNMKDGSFFIGLLLFTAWALWPQRSRRFSPFLWIFLFALIAGAGYAGHFGVYHLQRMAMRMVSHWWLARNSDPFKRTTAIGDLGELKLSNQIMFRVTPGDNPFRPVLLRESSYNLYRGTSWHASPAQFANVTSEQDQTTWNLHDDPGSGSSLTVWSPLEHEKGMLTLPLGTYQLANLPVLLLKQTPLGAVQVEDGPGLIGYQVQYNEAASKDLAPTEKDLIVPQEELPAIQQVIDELDLQAKTPEDVIQVLADFFQNQFRYSLKLRAAEQGRTSLASFLLSSRSGYCEYFATATVLILRACGIPARYATGWSAHEPSRLGDQIVIRSRHAHAWTLVYQDGLWHNLDTTSSSWVEEEDAAASSSLLFFQDLWSLMLFKFAQWRWGTEEGIVKKWWWLLLVPLVIILARRLQAGKRIRRVRMDTSKQTEQGQHHNSPFDRIEQRLHELGFERNPWEPPLSWIRRMQTAASLEMPFDSLQFCLHLYYQERFGKNGLTASQQAQFKKEVDVVLKGLQGDL